MTSGAPAVPLMGGPRDLPMSQPDPYRLLRHPLGAVVFAVLCAAAVPLGGYVIAWLSADGFGRRDHHRGGGSFIGASPEMSADGEAIVFASPATGDGDVYLHRVKEGRTIRLTDDPDFEADPSFSPDGRRIVFVRERRGVGHVRVMNADGSGQRQLTAGEHSDSDPHFSPDGRRIVFTRRIRSWHTIPGNGVSAELFLMHADGGDVTRLTDNNLAEGQASFTPDGSAIVFARGGDGAIHRMDLASGSVRRIGPGCSPAISRDGQRIVCQSGTPNDYGRTLTIMAADGGNARVLYTSSAYKSHPTFCLDDSHVLFLDEPSSDGTGWVCLLRLQDNRLTQVVRTDRP